MVRSKNYQSITRTTSLSHDEQGNDRLGPRIAQTNSEIQEIGEDDEDGGDQVLATDSRGRYQLQGNAVETDGIVYGRERDAPGQKCVYIPPGDFAQEDYRTATFVKFPRESPVLPVSLSKAGFYYTGYKDRAKCFSCGLAVESWCVGDDVYDARWHKNECLMSRNEDQRNVPSSTNSGSLFRNLKRRKMPVQTRHRQPPAMPNNEDDIVRQLRQVSIHRQQLHLATILHPEHEELLKRLNLCKESHRRSTFKKWPCYPAPFLVPALAQEGFFYLGNLDRTQCFSCSGVLRNWSPEDDIQAQHRRHFSNCRFVNDRTSCGNISMSDEERRDADDEDKIRLAMVLPSNDMDIVEPPNPSEDELRRLTVLYPCADPVTPDMRSEGSRLSSFGRNWPKDKIRATPQQIAKAGFYYLGEGDKTKCWYCNGGLQHWDPNDEPWTEHAKWFPSCEFVLRNKGREFVRRLEEIHPNLNRPTIHNARSHPAPPRETTQGPSATENQSLDLSGVRSMGFPEEQIQSLVRRKKNQTGVGYSEAQELIDDLLNEGNGGEIGQEGQYQVLQGAMNEPALIPAYATKRKNGMEMEQESGKKSRKDLNPNHLPMKTEENQNKEEYTRLRMSETCKTCFQNVAENVNIPCGHLAVCSNCVGSSGRCVVCKAKVQSTIKIYRA